MANPLVSYIIPNHNNGRFLAECIWSILSQTYHPIEVIVCDNGSTDNSRNILKTFEGTPNFKVILVDEAIGAARAVNRCLEVAEGEWVALIGSDDKVTPTHIADVMDFARANPEVDVWFGDLTQIDEEGKIKSQQVRIPNALDVIFQHCSIGLATGLIKKSAFDEVGGPDGKLEMSVDYEWIVRALTSGKAFRYCPKCGYLWRRFVTSGSLSIKYGPESPVRVKCHTYIRQTYKLKGSCLCGCGAKGVE